MADSNDQIAQEPLYIFAWGNNEKRREMKGRVCRVLYRGRMNSCLIQFTDNGQMEVVSRNALRKVVPDLFQN